MEELFRFLLTRPAQRVDAATETTPVTPSEEYHAELRRARASERPRSALRKAAERKQPVSSTDDLALGGRLRAFLDRVEGDEQMKLTELRKAVTDELGKPPRELIASQEFLADRGALADVLVTNAILGREEGVSSDEAARLLRAMALVERVAGDDHGLEEKGGVGRALGRTLLLPPEIFPIPPDGERKQPNGGPEKTDSRRTHLEKQRERLVSTYTMLTRIAPEHLAETVAHADGGDGDGRFEVALPPVPVGEDEAEHDLSARLRVEARAAATAAGAEVAHGIAAPLLLKKEVTARFGKNDRSVLHDRGLDLTRVSVPAAVERLGVELQEVDVELAELHTATNGQMVMIGHTPLPEAVTHVGTLVEGFAASALQVPSTHGSVAPAGIGDLLVVKQNLKRYEAHDLGHVENVLKGESKSREHRRARTTEETLTVETEVKREEERDLQSTERFELKSESSQVLKEDMSLKLGLAISGKYGPVVEFKASADFALNQSKEESRKVATSFSKDVTERASSRITERRREERILKTIEVFEEKNTHGIDNKTGTGHVVGQYQWIDKVYEAQVFNYGKRLLFDVMLPEPGSFLMYAMGAAPKAGADLVKPTPFTLSPADISEWNYGYYVKQYGVVGVTPPPAPYVTVSKALEGKGKQDDGATKAMEVPLPDGYQALSASFVAWYNRWSGGIVDVGIGNRMHRFSDNGGWSTSMSNEVGSVPLEVKTSKVEAFVVGVEVQCQRTQRALDDWKLKTHAAILQAYQALVRDYEDKLAALQIQAGVQIQGRNPAENEQLIRTELKKGALSVFTGQHFDLFGAIGVSSQGYPQPDLAEADAEGKYIRFFEQAFEWEQMMYFFYPYFWGRKPNWRQRALLQDVDPTFAEFLKAGAARIVVSVRPGFEQAVAHFLDTGEIWNGADLPPITSPLYVSIIEEIRERDEAPGDEVPQGDPWDVRIPTTLVKLREQASLPEWQKNAQGEWLPV